MPHEVKKKKSRLWKKKGRIPYNTTIQKILVPETHAVYFMDMQMLLKRKIYSIYFHLATTS